MPVSWTSKDPLKNIDHVDRDVCKNALKDIYLSPQSIEWDIAEAERKASEIISPPVSKSTTPEAHGFRPAEPPKDFKPKAVDTDFMPAAYSDQMPTVPTSPKDLYIQPPDVPRFDVKSPWFRQVVNAQEYIIYKSLPDIPTTQREISCSTQVDRMIERDLMKLFPNTLIRTRHASMYDPECGLPVDPDLGAIIPIEGFSSDLVRENIIRYPHIFRLYRMIDGKRVSFYNHIEIAGKLVPIHEIWFDLPESKAIPHTIEFMKEYVVRRYLLERDISQVHHVYPLYGSLDEFLTLFAPPAKYTEWKFGDTTELAKRCVRARVSYKQSRNPILEVCRQ
jgi:hypothetical protein